MCIRDRLKSKHMDAGLDPTQVKYVNEIEGAVIKRIEDILTPIVGPGNAKVQVAADIDFSQMEQTAEIHKPNTTPPDVSIRSQQSSETASATATAATTSAVAGRARCLWKDMAKTPRGPDPRPFILCSILVRQRPV